MRQIKFRAQDIASNKWLYGDLRYHKDDVCIFEQEGNKGEQVKRDTVGQFTCLYDKNGKEIYEGDIIKIPTKHGDDVFWIGYETSHIGAFCLCEDYDCNSTFVSIFGRNYNYEPFYCEVIGNIHDNPELMNVQNKKD